MPTTRRTRLIALALALAAAYGAAVLTARQQPGTAETISASFVRAAAGIDKLLPREAEAAYKALSARFQPSRAMETVSFMDRFWRLAGNSGYDASLDHLKAGLAAAGFKEGRPADGAAAFWIEEYPNGGNGWEPLRAEMTIVEPGGGGAPQPVFDPVIDYIAICINSFSTPAGGVTAPLLYVGTGTDAASYASVDVKGAVVLGDGGMRGLWEQAVRQRGAIGVISAAPPDHYTHPDVTPEVFQWGSVPYDEKSKAFGFKASRRVADQLKAKLGAGPVTVRTVVETKFRPASPGRLLVAEIPGRTKPGEKVVMVAHVQEPGANDDASGCATLLEMARALEAAIAAKAIPPPARTLTFVWGDEIRASREWLRADPARSTGSRYMISLDMTGENAAKTGGSFLIEKEPDPSAVWTRPSDPHTEWWGGGLYKVQALKGSLLNDLLLAACLRRARDTGWNVQTNPYEGGSDHTVFLASGIPAALATHFSDRYYHTNLDRADKTSPAEMANVGIAVGTAATLLASADQDEALAVSEIVATAASRRLDLERRQSAAIVQAAADRAAAETAEGAVLEAWKKWYARALESVLALPVTPAGEKLQGRVREAIARLNLAPAK
jgi:aminopeptidase YwaD